MKFFRKKKWITSQNFFWQPFKQSKKDESDQAITSSTSSITSSTPSIALSTPSIASSTVEYTLKGTLQTQSIVYLPRVLSSCPGSKACSHRCEIFVHFIFGSLTNYQKYQKNNPLFVFFQSYEEIKKERKKETKKEKRWNEIMKIN